jgi:hypothetical protein
MHHEKGMLVMRSVKECHCAAEGPLYGLSSCLVEVVVRP